MHRVQTGRMIGKGICTAEDKWKIQIDDVVESTKSTKKHESTRSNTKSMCRNHIYGSNKRILEVSRWEVYVPESLSSDYPTSPCPVNVGRTEKRESERLASSEKLSWNEHCVNILGGTKKMRVKKKNGLRIFTFGTIAIAFRQDVRGPWV